MSVLTPAIDATALIAPGARIGQGTRIGKHSRIHAGSVIGADCMVGEDVFIDETVRIGDHTEVRDGVSIHRGASVGARVTAYQCIDIGEYAVTGAGAVVTAPVQPHQLVAGRPARHQGWVCSCGEVLSRAAAPPRTCRCPPCERNRTSALAGGRDTVIPISTVEVGEAEQAAVLGVLESGNLASGTRVAELEAAFARAHGSAHAVAVSSGTAALVTALRAHRIGPGDEVITTPLTFVATLNAILEAGATARFCDVTDDLTLDPDGLEPLLTSRTRAILPVHLYGLPAAMEAIDAFAGQHGLAVIQDAAQAHGARIGTSPVGASGTAAFSFYATKNITCGEGGIVTTDDEQIADRIRLLRNHGMRQRYDYVLPGHNFRMPDLQAAIATVQLGRLAGINRRRAANASALSAGLTALPGLRLPAAPAGRGHVWHQYTIQLTSGAPIGRDELQQRLAASNIDARPYYPRLVHDYRCYRSHPQIVPDQTPRAEQAARQVLSLPVGPALTGTGLERIVSAVRTALGGR